MAGAGSVVRRLYLSVYNWVIFLGWAQVLYYAVLTLLMSGHGAVYAAVERPLQFAQTAAIIEIQSHVLVTPLVISWSITEIIRYSFFGMKETIGFTPSWLLWLRYNTFMVLYPIGILSEVGLICFALPYVKASEKYCFRMPNKWNGSLDHSYTSIVAIVFYVPGGPHMFRYMLAQRKKALSRSKTVAQVLYYAILALLGSGHETIYAAVEQPLLFTQTAAFMEMHSHVAVTSLILCWSIADIIRYSFFGLKETFGVTPYWLLWLRYSSFMVFVPIALVSELGLIYAALPYMKVSEKYCLRMPNKWNFSFYYDMASVLLTILYIPAGS
ncbi:hypothetical protein PR202_ga23470 [Eleusine coracana subsp. coracana]|uniref:Very-long-chain (3R)-3-hydroxyacyl-CoA dehydratase n=1 Tax=Eleusine coracana subsp. coracana TaxID=191504 RepID=A0AAV5D697_ELECO|nr:hypothetical protein PR202_ga23470 [Eleusine coracana subsp. coracana]